MRFIEQFLMGWSPPIGNIRAPSSLQGPLEAPRGSKEAWKMLFWLVLALFGVPGPSRYRICTTDPFLLAFYYGNR